MIHSPKQYGVQQRAPRVDSGQAFSLKVGSKASDIKSGKTLMSNATRKSAPPRTAHCSNQMPSSSEVVVGIEAQARQAGSGKATSQY